MNQIKCRMSTNNTPIFYTLDGAILKSVSSVSFEGSDDVFTVVNTNGGMSTFVKDHNGKLTLMKLEDIVMKLGLVVYKVA
ncbi:hypothetical protein [Pseudomonas sp.]|uniref:hypothetical protein n=1 Tax=Pseudomonas sp. TaxID=306 RepID=UPI003FD80D4A